jgi:glycosyltransferase involved in cell wall biosynthesis
MGEPDITVVIPVWDEYTRWLPDAVASIREQEVPVTLVVVDNSSRVELPPLEGPGAIRVVRSEGRLSLGAARNLGLGRVTTPFVLFWDADDRMLPGTLRWLREALHADPRLGVVAGSILESEKGPRHRWPRPWTYGLAGHQTLFALANSVWALYPTVGATLMRTELAREAGGFADREGDEDAFLGISLAFRARIRLDRRPGRVYRRHGRALLVAGPFTTRQLFAKARLSRELLRRDPAVPRWVKAALPAIALLQLSVIFLVRPIVVVIRRLRGERPAPGLHRGR